MIPLVMANEVGKAQSFNQNNFQNIILNCSISKYKLLIGIDLKKKFLGIEY